jgi:two-component system chemotaxis sensor kinase CheA
MDFDDDIMASFIEDTRGHLVGIESCLMDLEQAGAVADQELINTVFRAAHSIKGGAGFLGLSNVQALAHKLENVLHMVRNGELVPDNAVVSPLIEGFDLLRTLVENALDSSARDISEAVIALSDLATGHLPPACRDRLAQAVDVALPGGLSSIRLDRLSLEQAIQGGRYLYLVEYDLIHDIHARDKTPLDIIATMQSSGLILDCRMDLAAVGDLDAPQTNRIPFYLLYSTIVDPDVVGYLFALDTSRIHMVNHEALLAGSGPDPAHPGAPPFLLALTGDLGPDDLTALKSGLLAALEAHPDVTLDLNAAAPVTTAFVQFFCAAHRSFAARGKTLRLAGKAPDISRRLASLGFDPGGVAGCGLLTCPWFAGEDHS